MSGYQEYKCAVCGFEWQALEKGECPQCVTRKDAAPSTYPSAAEWRAARDRGDAFRDALCNLRECAHGTCWRMPGEIGMADMSVAEYIDTVLAAHGDGRLGALHAPDEATRLRDLLARALPVLKHVAVDGSSEAEALVGEVQGELAGAPGAPIRDWTEDAAHENGNYENRCIACGHHFKGHKRRIWCKVCAQSTPAPAPSASELALRADVARLRGALATVAVAPIDGVDAYTSLCCVRNCARDALAATAHGAPGRGESAEEGTAP